MKLKKKLFWANIGMISVPILIILTAGLLIFRLMYHMYWNPVENMFSDKNELVYAQSLIYNNREELSGLMAGGTEYRASRLNMLARQLQQLGYHFRYELDGVVEFDNLNELDRKALEDFSGDALKRLDHIVTDHNGDTFVKMSWYTKDHHATILAISPASVYAQISFSFFRSYIYPFLMVLFVTMFIAITFSNAMLNRMAYDNIIKPLSQLSKATRAIRNGDLSTQLIFPKNQDELKELFDDFQAMQQHLRDSVKRRQETEDSRRELLSSISHDLRTPLTSIKGYAEGLRDGIAKTPEKRRRYCNAILTRSMDMERMLEDLSIYNKLNRYHWNPEVTSLQALLHKFVEETRSQHHWTQMTLFEDYEPIPDLLIDVKEFRRILYNLSANTIKYRDKPNSVVWLKLRRLHDRVLFTYSDNGPGVPEDQLEKIFEAFYRGDQARTHTEESSGLGLSIVKQIAALHHGSVRAYNHNGLSIEITLPIHTKEDTHGTTNTHSGR